MYVLKNILNNVDRINLYAEQSCNGGVGVYYYVMCLYKGVSHGSVSV